MNVVPHPLTSKTAKKSSRDSFRLAVVVLLAASAGFVLMLGITQMLSDPRIEPPAAYSAAGLQGWCGDGYCDTAYENARTCPKDCGSPATEEPADNPPPPQVDWVCGNGICETEEGEGVWNCSQDCSWCGDNVCRPEEVDTCCGAGNDCTVAITCGDGICSACESNANCPKDCDVVDEPPSEEPPTATFTLQPVVEDESGDETDEPEEDTATPTETATEDPDRTSTPTETPTETSTPTDTPTPEPDTMGNCRIVSEDDIADPLVLAADANAPTGIEGFIAGFSGKSRRLWVICDEPPETVCLPARDLEGLEDVSWLDCASSGPACADTTTMEMVEGEICVSNSAGSLFITCEEGCTLRMDEEVNMVDYILPAIILLLLLALIIMLMFLMLSRRRRDTDEEEEVDDDYGPETLAL